MQEKDQENLKIIYSLEEILEKGYKIKTSIPKERKCPYCNKILKPKGILNPIDQSIHIFLQNEKCNCSKAIEEQNKLEEEKEKQLLEDFEKVRREELNKRVMQYYGTEFITKQFENQTLENFIINKTNQNMKYVAERFIKGFRNTKTGIIFVGKNGTGKTHISIAIANELRKQNIPIIFGTLTELLEKYSKSYKNNTDIELTRLYTKVDLLIIDDLGTEAMNNIKFTELFNIINTRLLNQNKTTKTIISTNLSLQNLFSNYDERIVSRIVGNYNICYFFGDDIRFKKKKK